MSSEWSRRCVTVLRPRSGNPWCRQKFSRACTPCGYVCTQRVRGGRQGPAPRSCGVVGYALVGRWISSMHLRLLVVRRKGGAGSTRQDGARRYRGFLLRGAACLPPSWSLRRLRLDGNAAADCRGFLLRGAAASRGYARPAEKHPAPLRARVRSPARGKALGSPARTGAPTGRRDVPKARYASGRGTPHTDWCMPASSAPPPALHLRALPARACRAGTPPSKRASCAARRQGAPARASARPRAACDAWHE